MELTVLYVVEIGDKKHYFATPQDRTYYVNQFWRNIPVIKIVEYTIPLEN